MDKMIIYFRKDNGINRFLSAYSPTRGIRISDQNRFEDGRLITKMEDYVDAIKNKWYKSLTFEIELVERV
jgi:hypothetical protein